MKKSIHFLFLIICINSLFAQTNSERYSTIAISSADFQSLTNDETHGLPLDHFHKNEKQLLELIFSESELLQIEERGISYEVIIEDCKKHFLQMEEASAQNRTVGCGLNNFDDGNMGGYHTYDQMVSNINNMQTQFPDLVDVLEIGQSIENRTIYAVKISDNVITDESDAEGVVYFEAVTHAREPMSLEATLYYMWWLLENYNSDPEAGYLVDHREIYFVPIVNVDGYVYNETTDPNGGGFWRKNRRDAGNGCFGVDLNRNYPKGWGLNSGSSNDPCNDTYRGTAPFSEPETQAIADFLEIIEPAIAFSSHTHGDKFLSPWGYVDSLATYELYAEFVSEFIPENYAGYGTTAKMLNYTSSGTTRDYFHSQGIPTWTPEIGHSFWEPSSVICDRVMEFLKPMKYLSWVSGDYACFHDFSMSNQEIWNGEVITMDIRVKNRGLTKTAPDVMVALSSGHPSVDVLNSEVSFGDIPPREFIESINAPFQFEIISDVALGEQIPLLVEVYQDNALSYSKEIFVTAGAQTVLYQTDFETDNAWLVPALEWDSSFMDAVSEAHSFADSRYGNYLANSNSMVIMDQPVDLSLATHPIVTFNAKWALEPNDDYVSFLVSTNGTSNWTALPGWHTDGLDLYNKNKYWVQEFIDLSPYIGESEVYFALQLLSDNSVHSDGFYMDDFMVSDFTEPVMSGADKFGGYSLDWKISPNPTMGKCQVNVSSKTFMDADITVHDLDGKLLLQKPVELQNGDNSIDLNLESLTPGVYTVQLRTKGAVHQRKVVVAE